MTAHISNDGSGREETVAEHTEKTAYLCKKYGDRCGMGQMMTLCGVCHDMGKNKQKFDDYIHADENIRKRMRGTIAHASTGAKYICDTNVGVSGITKVMTELISYAVAAHHGVFDCVSQERTDLFSDRLSRVEDYDEACDNAKLAYLNQYEMDRIFSEATEEFDQIWITMKGVIQRVTSVLPPPNKQKAKEISSECRSFLFSCLQRLMLSVLIDADWEATADFMENVDTLSKREDVGRQKIFQEASENFDIYMRKKQQSVCLASLTDRERDIAAGRNAMQEECRKFAEYPAGIYCLPIPTGGGKTLSSLAYALEYCRRNPDTERIIYVSPYISITEQNARVFRDAVGRDEWVLEHHSSVLRDMETGSEGDQRNRFVQQDINWEEPFICTTFVQFMNTLFSDQSVSVRRMHRLAHSVVIIDEVQSMPVKCIHTFNYMINFLNAVCHTNVILCTATQPALEAVIHPICYSEPKYMIKDAEIWFRRFERVRLHIPEKGEKYTFERLGDEIIAQMEKVQSILVILNTKSAVGRLYDILKTFHIRVEYLTTNLCAEHRSDKIAAIRKILEEGKEKIVVVSTNLIEAGVDISFECVYRSMVGLDGFAQSAGRCNRNGERESGSVYLIPLENENTGNMTDLLQNIRVTEQILYEYQNSDDRDNLLLPKWMDAYYKKVYLENEDQMDFPIEKMDTSIMELLSEGFPCMERKRFMNQAYKTAGQAYRVIDDCSFGVIVPYKKGQELLAAIQESSDFTEMKKYIRQAQRYTVNVRENQLKKFEGLIQPVSEKIPGLYMVAAPGAYSEERGITAEWEPLIF